MSLNDPSLPKQYKNRKVLFEQNLDAWRVATEESISTVNLNLTQIAKDCFLTGYEYDNDGNNNLSNSLQGQINLLSSGGTPITGTSSDTFVVNSDGNSATLTTAALTGNYSFSFPNASGTFVLDTSTQTLTNKTLTNPDINGGTATSPILTTPDINGGTADSLTSLSVRSTAAEFDTKIASDEALTANRTLKITLGNADRRITLSENFSTIGAGTLALTVTGPTNVTLPTSGTLATLAGSETFANKVLTTPTIASFTNATHNHSNAAGGGTLSAGVIVSGQINDEQISSSSVIQYQAALSIAETQIPDGSVLARVAGNETISGSWSFSNQIVVASVDPPSSVQNVTKKSQLGLWLWYDDDSGDISKSYNVSSLSDDDGDGFYQVFVDTNFEGGTIEYAANVTPYSTTDDFGMVINWDPSEIDVYIYDISAGAKNDCSFNLIATGIENT